MSSDFVVVKVETPLVVGHDTSAVGYWTLTDFGISSAHHGDNFVNMKQLGASTVVR